MDLYASGGFITQCRPMLALHIPALSPTRRKEETKTSTQEPYIYGSSYISFYFYRPFSTAVASNFALIPSESDSDNDNDDDDNNKNCHDPLTELFSEILENLK